ncbi:MAG: protein-L-isoaspartate O-methyltransferase family protein [Vulcanimicrobiaceae bacterium]
MVFAESAGEPSDAARIAAMVAHLERSGVLRDARIASALRRVSRHRFIPWLTREQAYADRAMAIKESPGGILASISQPSMIVEMLQMLDPRPGQRVLEIGTGSGYNAALLAELVGADGAVVTYELEADLASRAAELLAQMGYHRVRVIAENALRIGADIGVFDRLIVTAKVARIAPAWLDGLADRGRLVVPIEGSDNGEQVVAYLKHGHDLIRYGAVPCAFIPLREE